MVKHYAKAFAGHEGKITLGISAYDLISSPRDVQKIGLMLKSKLKQSGVSVKIISIILLLILSFCAFGQTSDQLKERKSYDHQYVIDELKAKVPNYQEIENGK